MYANMNTIKEMMSNAQDIGFHYFDDVNADRAISSVMIKVQDGYSIEDVTDDINIHVRHVEATQAKSMISSIAGGLSNVSGMIGILIAMIWILAIVILMIAFAMIINERKKEFAILRVAGASQRMLSRLLRTESAILSITGSIAGAGAACLIVFPFSGLIRDQLDLPYLLPNIAWIIALLTGAVVISVLAGWMTSLFSAHKIGQNETGLVLREDA